MSHKSSKKKRQEEIKLDLGCGPNPRDGFIGIDIIDFGKNKVYDLRNKGAWQWIKDESVTEIHSSHFVEHLTAIQRILFVNQCYRIMKRDAIMTMITPHWSSCRAYGDPTHIWPPISEFWFFYLDKEWRTNNAPHTDIKYNSEGFNCNLEVTWGFNLPPHITVKSQEAQQFAMANYKDVCMDIIATFKRKD